MSSTGACFCGPLLRAALVGRSCGMGLPRVGIRSVGTAHVLSSPSCRFQLPPRLVAVHRPFGCRGRSTINLRIGASLECSRMQDGGLRDSLHSILMQLPQPDLQNDSFYINRENYLEYSCCCYPCGSRVTEVLIGSWQLAFTMICD